MLHYYVTLFLVAMVATWWIFKKVLKIAMMKNIVDNPDARKLQRTPVPVLGGVAVFFGMIVALVVTRLLFDTYTLFAIMGVMTIMLYLGTMDDILSLSPKLRFVVEIGVVCLLIYCNDYSINDFHGLWGIYQISEWIAVPLTIFACVGIINSINMIDGVNGLSSGYCITTCAIFGSAFILTEDKDAASLAMLSVGALIPFFIHNVFGKKSKMFIGDGGTLLMGTIISTFVIGALNVNSPLAEKVSPNFSVIAFALSLLVMPVFDCLRVMVSRVLRRTSPFYPDRTHFHHLLFDMGFSHVGTTCIEISLNILIVLSWWISYKLGASVDVQLYIVVLLGLLCTVGIYTFLRNQEKNNTKLFQSIQNFSKKTHFGHTNWWQSYSKFLDRDIDDIK